jgi:hypothetical protein
MSAASNYLEDKLLDHVLRYGNGSLTAGTGAGYQPPATVYVALFASGGAGSNATLANALETGTSGTGSTADWGYFEILTTGSTNYGRQSVTFGAAGTAGSNAIGTIKTSTTVSFNVTGADYETAGTTGNVVTHIAIMDASTGGNVLFYGQLTTSKTVSAGDQFTVSTGNLAVSLA